MMTVVTGGSGSGKSAFAEDKIVSFGPAKRIYIATMHPYDEESHKRVARHRKMRAGKGFETVECYTGLKNLDFPENAVVLLECMSNLAANEMFEEKGAGEKTVEAVLEGIKKLSSQVRHLVIVTNEIFSEAASYEGDTIRYQEYLGIINQNIGKMADEVVEVVYGIPDWNKENMKYTFCFFPFIGLVIGALSYLVGWAGGKFGFNPSFVSAVLVLVPVMVTGGIHVDGLLDTSDALSSWQERERRLEILKDSHAGAFAVITACAFFLIWYGAYSQLWTDRRALLIMALGFMVSRCLSGISVMMFPKARKDGTVAEFSRKAEDMIVRNVLIVYLGILLAVMIWIQPVMGILAFGTAVLVFLYYHYKAMKYFGGITGDLAGYFLCLCEVGMAVVLAVVSVFI